MPVKRGTFFNLHLPYKGRPIFKNISLYLSFFFIFPVFLSAQSRECSEVLVLLQVEHIGNTQLSSFICGEDIYLSVPEVMDFLQIRNIPSNDFSRIEGFFIDRKNSFTFNQPNNFITYRNKKIPLQENSFIRTRTNLFLKSGYFEEIFGLKNTFTFYNLSVALSSELELPSIKAARRKQMRENINMLKNEFTADTVITRNHPLFHLGTMNWDFRFKQSIGDYHYNRMNLSLGGILAGGEFTGSINYSPEEPFTLENQYYLWRYVDNDNAFFRQVMAGKIGSSSISTIYEPVNGIQLTNAPTSLRKSFGSYVLSDYTQPGWIVELYINNVLVDFLKADASGFFSFNVPLMYGKTEVSLRFYGPWGEERESMRNFNIPFNFLPKNEFEYTIRSGIVEDKNRSVFAHGRFNYGISRNITIGGGVEYLSSNPKNSFIPFFNTSVKLTPEVLFSGEYLHKVAFRGSLNYATPSDITLELKYSKYEKDQQAIRFNYLEERQFRISVPLDFKHLSGTTRLSISQNILPHNSYINSQLMFSGKALGLDFNMTTQAFFPEISDPVILSNLSTSFDLPAGITFSPHLVYDFSSNSLSSYRGEMRKKIFKNGFLNVSFTRDIKYDQSYFNTGFRYDLSFSRLALFSNVSDRHTSFTESIGGSVIFEPKADYIKFTNNIGLGRGSVKFTAYLDINGNRTKEPTEPLIEGLRVQSPGMGIKETTAAGATIITGLEPYVFYNFNLDTQNLNRIAWRVKNTSLRISVNPNQMKHIEVPVAVVGEVAGFVLFRENEILKGIGGIELNILNENEELVKKITSQSDGYFSYLGLESGHYTIEIDRAQLQKLKMEATEPLPFDLENNIDGGIKDNIEFILNENLNFKERE